MASTFEVPRRREDWEREHPNVVHAADAIMELLRRNSESSHRIEAKWDRIARISFYVDGCRKLADCQPPRNAPKDGKRTYLHIDSTYLRRDWMEKWGERLQRERIGSLQKVKGRLCIKLTEPTVVKDKFATLSELLRDVFNKIAPG